MWACPKLSDMGTPCKRRLVAAKVPSLCKNCEAKNGKVTDESEGKGDDDNKGDGGEGGSSKDGDKKRNKSSVKKNNGKSKEGERIEMKAGEDYLKHVREDHQDEEVTWVNRSRQNDKDHTEETDVVEQDTLEQHDGVPPEVPDPPNNDD